MIKKMLDEVKQIEAQFLEGLITQGEAYMRISGAVMKYAEWGVATLAKEKSDAEGV